MKEFDNIQDLLDNYKKTIFKKDKKIYSEAAAKIYLKNAGYTNFDNIDINAIYRELNDISFKNGIRGENSQYLSVKNEDIMNSVIANGSEQLKKFLSNNGYFIIEVPQITRLKDLSLKKNSSRDTVLLGSLKENMSRPRSSTNLRRSRSDSFKLLEDKRRSGHLDVPSRDGSVSSSIRSKSTINDL